ncbi:MAG: IPT/TIG domain-containing protein, partial [Thermoanaerobaculia bacterium]
MRTLRQRKYLFALLAILALFAACKGESPTVPPIGSGGPGGSGTPPPVGSSVAITATNLNPISGSIVGLVVTVSQNNQPVPNGTAVELSTTRGNFVDPTSAASLGTATILTTNNGQVLVNLTSSTAGAALVRAVVNNVAAQLMLNFQVGTVTPGGGGTAPTVSSVSPGFGPPQGGQTITISGTNFRAPVRVLFDFGSPIGMKEAFVVSVTATQIVVLTPAVDLAAAQSLPATIKVIVGAGSTGEQSVTFGTPFNYVAQVLTPIITTLSPASGPIDGGTRVTIFGSGFQAPVQVFFGSAEAQVLTTTFDQIIAMSPTARDTNPDGSGPATGPIPVKVINIASNTQVTLAGAFRYTPKMQITAVGPTIGPGTGGTRVTIDGVGFNDPVAVSLGGFAAQPIKVSGTQIIAVTLPLPQIT